MRGTSKSSHRNLAGRCEALLEARILLDRTMSGNSKGGSAAEKRSIAVIGASGLTLLCDSASVLQREYAGHSSSGDREA